MARAILRKSFRSKRSMSSAPLRPYTFHIGASWAGKNTDARKGRKAPSFPPDSDIGMWRDHTLSRPKAVNSTSAGQDFLFVQAMRNNSGIAFGVADGVGGWEESGVDPSLFSQALMFHAHRYSRNAWAGEPEIDPTLDYEEREEVEGWEMTPYECLDLAYGGVLREKFVQAGASTACLVTLNASSGVLRSAKFVFPSMSYVCLYTDPVLLVSLGDSGFIVIRSNSILYRQRPQTHFFNCPKQLTKLPTSSLRRFSRACVDSPSEAETYRVKLGDGDIVIAYTDGLADNVFASEVVQLCALVSRRGGTEDEQVQTIADRLVDYARLCMHSTVRVSPFESVFGLFGSKN
ncbi:hypothetical protein C0992_000154 [Termitomyces sp. T32_za158]|nr:hypothetical protein C0992_000154 [Termitomyces sp. T32_za158]